LSVQQFTAILRLAVTRLPGRYVKITCRRQNALGAVKWCPVVVLDGFASASAAAFALVKKVIVRCTALFHRLDERSLAGKAASTKY
jgi:hypothetical protein